MRLKYQYSGRVIILFGLLLVTGFSFWLLNNLTAPVEIAASHGQNLPDYYMEDFSTIIMDPDGLPSHHLRALYVVHYPEGDSTELTQPSLEFRQQANNPVHISADKGWVTSGNEVILLDGNVEILEQDSAGAALLQIRTIKARFLPGSGYAETDQHTEITTSRAHVTGTGMRAYLHEGRLEVLSNVRTIITKK